MSTPRVRFAPSPTGYFHVGSARTALFNWLFARQSGGTFILRIEDTDTERNREEWVTGIISAMAWLGMSPDEGPYRQSERTQVYQAAIGALYEGGYLYACDCTRDVVLARTKDKATPGYDGHCRDRKIQREGNALRFRSPDDGETVVRDVIRGDVSFPHSAMEDFIVAKSSGQPLFVLANVIDDRDMGITHVIRGEDLLPTCPKGILIWQALDRVAGEVQQPLWAHLPMLVNEKRKKLSKRKDPVAVESYRDHGYLPEAFRNYLALLGWSPRSGEEKTSLEELIRQFRLEDVNHAPAFFDLHKLTHMNGEYIREMSVDAFIEQARPWIAPGEERANGRWVPRASDPPGVVREEADAVTRDYPERETPWPMEKFDWELFISIAPLVQERVTTLGEVPSMVDFFFLDPPVIDDAALAKVLVGDDQASTILNAARRAYQATDFTPGALKDATIALGEAVGKKLAKAQAPIRVAVTGRSVGPPLFESLSLLGREAVDRRLALAIERISRHP